MKSIGLALLLTAQISAAQSYRINYQPRVGEVVRHQMTFSYRYTGKGQGLAETGAITRVMRCEQKILKVTRELVEAKITIKLLSANATGSASTIKPVQPEYTTHSGYGPESPLGFMSFLSEALPPEDEDVFVWATLPRLYPGPMSVGSHSDTGRPFVGDSIFGRPNWRAAQCTVHYLSNSNDTANFESKVLVPLENETDFISSIGEIGVLSEIALHLKTGSVERVQSQGSFSFKSRIKSGASEGKRSEAKVTFSLLVQRI